MPTETKRQPFRRLKHRIIYQVPGSPNVCPSRQMVQNVCPNRPEMSSFALGRELEAIASNYSIQNPDRPVVIAKAIHSWPKEPGSYRCGRLPIGGIRKAVSIQA
ncbi:hypothetical protein CA51_29880 [Rosistilla oblonga]|nr:hypothetical protein CA51_29880 [Rosistilla oblonga]